MTNLEDKMKQLQEQFDKLNTVQESQFNLLQNYLDDIKKE